jgi:Arc/MetJ family transcription regulator
MRTNIVIDDQLMADVMASGDYKTKREAVEEGLRLLKRKKAYAALLAARGTLFWDDSDEAWAKVREEAESQDAVANELAACYEVKPRKSARKSSVANASKSRTRSPGA